MRWLVFVLLVLSSMRAHADTIVLVSDDTALHAALVDAGDNVTVANEKAPGVGDLAASSRALADRLGASVTVWLIPGGATTSLVTYDRVADRVIVRELPYAPPLDAARATEAARIVRTMLRSMRTPDETVDARPAVVVPVVPVPEEPQFSIGAGGGVWIAAPGALANAAVTITTAWRPRGLGAAVAATLAPAPDLEMSAFRGDVRDVVLAGVVRNALAFGPDVRLVPSAGMALHMVHLDGTSGGTPLDSRRYDPALRVGLAAMRGLPRGLETGLDVSADCLLRRQSYTAGNEQILLVPRVQIVATLVIGIQL